MKTWSILCLVKSRSIDGKPMKAIKEGTIDVRKMCSKTNSLDNKYAILFYINKHKTKLCIVKSFREQIWSFLYTKGCTYFDRIFTKIYKNMAIINKWNLQDMFMLMTDGWTNVLLVIEVLSNLKEQLNVKQLIGLFASGSVITMM